MNDSEDDNASCLDPKINRVGKAFDQCLACIVMYFGESLRILANIVKRLLQLQSKLQTKTLSLLVVLDCCFPCFTFRIDE